MKKADVNLSKEAQARGISRKPGEVAKPPKGKKRVLPTPSEEALDDVVELPPVDEEEEDASTIDFASIAFPPPFEIDDTPRA